MKTNMETRKPRVLNFLSPEMEQQVVSFSEHMSVDKGVVLLEPGDRMDQVLFLVKGKVALYRTSATGRRHLMYTLNGACGCGLSMISAMLNRESVITAVVEEPAELFSLPVSQFSKFMQSNPDWTTFVLNIVEKQWIESLEMFDQVAFNSLEVRLTSYFQNYITHNVGLENASTVNKPHSQIANDLNASREAVSRVLKKMEQKGQLQLRHGAVELLMYH